MNPSSVTQRLCQIKVPVLVVATGDGPAGGDHLVLTAGPEKPGQNGGVGPARETHPGQAPVTVDEGAAVPVGHEGVITEHLRRRPVRRDGQRRRDASAPVLSCSDRAPGTLPHYPPALGGNGRLRSTATLPATGRWVALGNGSQSGSSRSAFTTVAVGRPDRAASRRRHGEDRVRGAHRTAGRMGRRHHLRPAR